MSAIALTTLAVGAAPAGAAERRSLCAKRANLRDSPDGFVIGRLRRPQRLTVLRRSANRRWANVRVQSGLVGWLPAGSVCRGR
jgi:hypothetical protein